MENDDQLTPAVDVSAFTPLQQYYYAEQLRCLVKADYFHYLAGLAGRSGDKDGAEFGKIRARAEIRLARAWQRLRDNGAADRPPTSAYMVDWSDVVADATVAAAKASPGGLSECQQELRRKGNRYPRTCKVCGLGPCHYQGKTP